MKLRTKFSALIGLLVVIIVSGVAVTLYIAESRFLVDEMERSRTDMMKSLAQVAKESIVVNDEILLLNYLKLVKNTKGVMFVSVTDTGGKVLAHTDINLLGTELKDEQTAASLKVEGLVPASHAGVLELAMPVIVNDAKAGIIRIGFSQEALNDEVNLALAVTRKRIAMVAVAALIVGLAGALFLTAMMVGPIRTIAQGAQVIGKGKLDHKITVQSRDELGYLAGEFNKMSERLKELDQLKSDFVSSVTHELRSPLLSLRMYIDMFFKGTAGEINDKQKEYLQVMRDCATRLSKFIDDLLDMAKIERGKMEVNAQVVKLPPLLVEIGQLFKPQVDNKNISLSFNVQESLPDVQIDPERTRQVLINLLSNAVKFTPMGGKINVDARFSPAHKMVEVAVSDTGMGIPADKLDRIFDKFEQVKDGREKISGPKGSGLGLSIVKGLLEMQGGTINVTSELGKGSKFAFTLPLAKQ
ncbi:MAG: hypothetical protein A2293_01385 [Elusimicrobia bacterium RIFOXYB2_FULL_49_7]|nr:MAG: hypothetical protein A2293_01385 [Elusimicrobia bacterium RIFOXYB2_FULL_49_7]